MSTRTVIFFGNFSSLTQEKKEREKTTSTLRRPFFSIHRLILQSRGKAPCPLLGLLVVTVFLDRLLLRAVGYKTQN
ncbi:hypothetical protein LX36DRAFT_217667 [Colletotrichum falcatum]|nr:hypothetical protein LX36DRAFT_217667 [Colletotrichum falcatum]